MSGYRPLLLMTTFVAVGLLLYTIARVHTIDVQNRYAHMSDRVRLVAAADQRQTMALNYGIVVDAGSSGSRLFVYTWPQHDGNVDHLIDIQPLIAEGKPVVEKIKPGLSSLTGNLSSTAAEYMTPLLEIAARHIPEAQHSATPLFIYATAGMRLLPDEDQRAIMGNLRSELPTKFSFHMIDTHMTIIDGQTEGVYSWIAINYILGKFHHDSSSVANDESVTSQIVPPSVDRPQTVGVIDMGGASLQIAYELRGKIDPRWKKYVKYINLGCTDHDTHHEYAVFVVTFLELGANQAMERYKTVMTEKARRLAVDSPPSNHSHNHTTTVLDPCMPNKWSKAYRVDDDFTYNRRGTGDYSQCLTDIVPLLDRGSECDDHPCSMSEVNVTDMVDINQMQLYGFSEYWYSQYDILGLQGDYNATMLKEKASDFCATEWSTLKRRADHKPPLYPRSDRARLITQCFKSAWISQVLHGGFGLSKQSHHFKTVQSIGGQEVQWTLGALLHQMRYFPLRELDRARLSLERARHEEHLHTGVGVPPTMLSVGLVALVVLVLLVYVHRQRGRRRGLRRSDYSYMSVPGAIKEHNVQFVTSDYVY